MKTAPRTDISRHTATFRVSPFSYREMPAPQQHHGCLPEENYPTFA
jgi:hypothetical protein